MKYGLPPPRPIWHNSRVAPDPARGAPALAHVQHGKNTEDQQGATQVDDVVAGRAGHPIGFRTFFRYGAIVVAESLVIASAWVWLRYLA